MDMRMRMDRAEMGVGGESADRPSIDEKTLKINVIREPACVPMSRRMREVCWDFGIPPRESPAILADNLEVTLQPGSLLFLTGPSGSGKSSILQAMVVGQFPARPKTRFLSDIASPRNYPGHIGNDREYE